MVVGVLAGDEGGARRAAEREGIDRVGEAGPPVGEQLADVGMWATSVSASSSVITTRMFGRLPIPALRACAGETATIASTEIAQHATRTRFIVLLTRLSSRRPFPARGGAVPFPCGGSITPRVTRCQLVYAVRCADRDRPGAEPPDQARGPGQDHRRRDGPDPPPLLRRPQRRRGDARRRARADDLLPPLRRPRRPPYPGQPGSDRGALRSPAAARGGDARRRDRGDQAGTRAGFGGLSPPRTAAARSRRGGDQRRGAGPRSRSDAEAVHRPQSPLPERGAGARR